MGATAKLPVLELLSDEMRAVLARGNPPAPGEDVTSVVSIDGQRRAYAAERAYWNEGWAGDVGDGGRRGRHRPRCRADPALLAGDGFSAARHALHPWRRLDRRQPRHPRPHHADAGPRPVASSWGSTTRCRRKSGSPWPSNSAGRWLAICTGTEATTASMVSGWRSRGTAPERR